MQYGHFDDLAREYVITRPDTPSPWINYLGSETFFTLMSNTSGGYSFYKDARMLRLTRYRYNNVPTDAGGQYFYINDSGSVWTPGWMPVKAKLDSYECRHGLGYTRITGVKDGLKAQQLSFVPRGVNALVTRVQLTNESAAVKNVSLFSFVEFCLWNAQDDSTNFQRNFSTGEVEIEGSAIYHKTEYRERRNHFAVYAVNADIDGFDTDRASFIGYYNGFGEAQVPFANKSSNSVARTKLGTAVSSVVKKTMILSGSLFLIRAAMLPKIVPSMRATIMADMPSLADMGKDSPMIEEISLPFLSDTPKSPCSIPFIYRMNCSPTGLSMPYLAFSAATVASLIAFSLLNGPPGTACMEKNVIAQMIKTVSTARRMRFRIYLITFLSPFLFRFCS